MGHLPISFNEDRKPINQLVGACYGQILIGLVAYLIFRPVITTAATMIAKLS